MSERIRVGTRGSKLALAQTREVVEKLSDDDLNMLAETLTGDDLIEFSRGNKLFNLGKILLKNPKLITLAKKLI